MIKTWEELCEKAKSLDEYKQIKDNFIYYCGLYFKRNGNIEFYYSYPNNYYEDEKVDECEILSTNRTPEQMWQIMENLQ